MVVRSRSAANAQHERPGLPCQVASIAGLISPTTKSGKCTSPACRVHLDTSSLTTWSSDWRTGAVTGAHQHGRHSKMTRCFGHITRGFYSHDIG